MNDHNELIDRIAELESSLAATSDMVNKSFSDGKAEGHGDATAEASVVIGELRARVSTLEADLKEVEKQEPVAWLDKSTEERPGDTVWLPGDLKGMDTSWLVPLYAAPPVTAPVRLTDKQIYEMAEDGEFLGNVKEIARTIETAVLRANGFKVDNQ